MSAVLGIVGPDGRIGELVGRLALSQGWRVIPVRRGGSEELGSPGAPCPILVCTRNDALPAVIAAIHPSRHPDLVFVQNGMVQPWLGARGLVDATQGVLYVAVTAVGAPPVPGGDSVFFGRWAPEIAGLLAAGGVDARAVVRVELQREIAVKLAWICVFGVLGGATGLVVGQVVERHLEDVRALTHELHPLLAVQPGLDLSAVELADRLVSYTARIPHFPASVKEWRWRNGWVTSAAQRLRLPLPLHDRWLAQAGGAPVG